MKTKEKLRTILGVVLLVALAHVSSVHGCSGGNKEQDPSTDDPVSPVKNCTEHVCNDNLKCFTHAQQCDNIQDCDDNTDEDVGHCGKNNRKYIIGYYNNPHSFLCNSISISFVSFR